MKRGMVLPALLAFAASAQAEDFTHRFYAEQLINVMNQNAPFDDQLKATGQEVLDSLTLTVCGDKSAAELKPLIDDVFSYKTMRPYLIQAYAETFTLSELVDMTAFYRTSSGAKLLQRTPQLMGAVQSASDRLISEKRKEVDAIMARHSAECKPDEKVTPKAAAPAAAAGGAQ